MSDIKLYRVQSEQVAELAGYSVQIDFMQLDPSTVAIELGFTSDVRVIGHYGTGELKVSC